VKVADRRMGRDFAECMRDLLDRHYASAEKIRVVLDNLSTHSAASLRANRAKLDMEEVREYFRLFDRLDLLNEFLREID
jgi:hypothetical protein